MKYITSLGEPTGFLTVIVDQCAECYVLCSEASVVIVHDDLNPLPRHLQPLNKLGYARIANRPLISLNAY